MISIISTDKSWRKGIYIKTFAVSLTLTDAITLPIQFAPANANVFIAIALNCFDTPVFNKIGKGFSGRWWGWGARDLTFFWGSFTWGLCPSPLPCCASPSQPSKKSRTYSCLLSWLGEVCCTNQVLNEHGLGSKASALTTWLSASPIIK